jgi:hypothetical protein
MAAAVVPTAQIPLNTIRPDNYQFTGHMVFNNNGDYRRAKSKYSKRVRIGEREIDFPAGSMLKAYNNGRVVFDTDASGNPVPDRPVTTTTTTRSNPMYHTTIRRSPRRRAARRKTRRYSRRALLI